MGISTAVSIALSGLKNNQTETELVSKNIANADTAGYTAKRLVRSELTADQQLIGIKSVVQRQVSNEIIKQLNASTSTSAFLSTKADYLSQIDSMIGSTTSGFSLSDLTESFTESLQTLAATPDNQNAQIEAVKSAQDLASALNQLSDDVQQMRTDLEAGIADGVQQVNTILKNIDVYNKKITSQKVAGVDTTDLEDARDSAIHSLSEWMDVKTYNNSDGSTYVYTQSGTTLVASEAATLNFDQRGTLTAATEWSADSGSRQAGTITVSSSSMGAIDLIANGTLRSGKLAAMVELRDDTLVSLQNQLDDVAVALARSLSDVTLQGTPETQGALSGFSLDLANVQPGNAATVTVASASGVAKTFSFVRVDDPNTLPLDNSATGRTDDTVVGIDWSGGISSVVSQMQSALGSGYVVDNSGGDTIRILDAGSGTAVKSASVTYTATGTQDGTIAMPLFVDGSGNDAYTGSFDGQLQKTGFASRITVNSAITGDPTLLVKYDATTQTGDSARPQALADAITSMQFTFGSETGLVSSKGSTTGTLSSFLNTITSYWGSQSENAIAASDSQGVIQTNLETRYSDKSSVNIDEEMARLIQIQAAYAANARVFSVAKEMLDTLMQA